MALLLITGIGSSRARTRDARVVALVDDEARRRVHDALGGQATTLPCLTPADVELIVGAQRPDCVVVTPWDDNGQPSAVAVRRLRSRFPWLSIAVYWHLEPRSAHEIATLTQAGADTIIIRGHDDLGRILRERLAAAWPRRVATDAMAALSPWATPDSTPILSYCLLHAARPLTVRAEGPTPGTSPSAHGPW